MAFGSTRTTIRYLELEFVLLGGAGGGCDGLTFPRVGVPDGLNASLLSIEVGDIMPPLTNPLVAEGESICCVCCNMCC